MIYAQRIKAVFVMLLLAGALTACQSGAVVFAPTPLPPDLSPLRWDHPTGAFSIEVPRDWAVHTQNAPSLASASFSRPGDPQPALLVAVTRLVEPIPLDGVGDLMSEYQSEIRPDLTRYREQDRQAMGDGSWRLSGVRSQSGGLFQQVNTFIEANGDLVAVTEVIVPPDPTTREQLQRAVNTLQLNAESALQASGLETLRFARATPLDVLSVRGWNSAEGVFFVTGEIANYSDQPVRGVPVRVSLLNVDGAPVIEAIDTAMGYGIPPGGFAPFSLRFGQGRPVEAATFTVTVETPPESASPAPIYSNDRLDWTDESQFTDSGDLLVTGTVTNTGSTALRDPLALVTVFDVEQNVIGAWFAPLVDDEIASGEALPFEVLVAELGADPFNYIVEIQALGEGG